MRHQLRQVWLLLSLTLAACRGVATDKPTALENCAAIEGEPIGNGPHANFVRCLVDRYGWDPQEAAGATAARALTNTQRLRAIEDAKQKRIDSIAQAQRHVIDSAVAVERAHEEMVKRHDDSILVATGQTPYVADRNGQYYYSNSDALCVPLRSVLRERRVYFLTQGAAEAAGFRASVLPGCR